MIVFVNQIEISLFSGAKVIDAIRAYYSGLGKVMPRILPAVSDVYGNSVAPDGELREGSRLLIQKIKNKK